MKLEDIKTGGFYFYTEQCYGTNYADTLVEVRNVDGVDMAHPIATNWKGAYINETPKNWGEDLPVPTCYDERCWHPCDYTPADGNPAVWMAENYPLENPTGQEPPTEDETEQP
jgi:hypothetical protein